MTKIVLSVPLFFSLEAIKTIGKEISEIILIEKTGTAIIATGMRAKNKKPWFVTAPSVINVGKTIAADTITSVKKTIVIFDKKIVWGLMGSPKKNSLSFDKNKKLIAETVPKNTVSKKSAKSIVVKTCEIAALSAAISLPVATMTTTAMAANRTYTADMIIIAASCLLSRRLIESVKNSFNSRLY